MKLRPASKEGVWVNIYYPLIVFDGKLFVARLNGEDIDVEEKKHVLYCALHESKLNLPETFDIVTYDYLEEYLTVLDKSHKVTVDYFQQVAKRYNRTPTS
jgi:hypothetical protein